MKSFWLLFLVLTCGTAGAQVMPDKSEFLASVRALDSLMISDWTQLRGEAVQADGDLVTYRAARQLPGFRDARLLVKDGGQFVNYFAVFTEDTSRTRAMDAFSAFERWTEEWAWSLYRVQPSWDINDAVPEATESTVYWYNTGAPGYTFYLACYSDKGLWVTKAGLFH